MEDSNAFFHMLHRYAAVVMAVAQVGLVITVLRARGTLRWSGVLLGALLLLSAVQIALGALNVWYEFPDVLAVSHTFVASLIWGVATAIAVLALRPGSSESASLRVPAAPAETITPRAPA